MRIALVAPSAVPFTPGGAERLWWGLTTWVNRHTDHAMELIKLPSPERSFWEIVHSYRQFSLLDLGHFDMVISTKYPAWMVAHEHHVVYLQHTLRGLYDTYPAHLPEDPGRLPPSVAPLWNLLRRPQLDRSALPELWERLESLRSDQRIAQDVMAGLTAFPGPFARAVVHALDRIGLARRSVRRHLAISKTVAHRANYFPPGATVDVVPHPPDLDGFRCEPGEFIFTASRLDGAKRLDLLIRAYRQSRTDAPLLIAGEGPAGAGLRALAGGDDRIRFVGRLTDDELLSHYARAHFVVFVPYQEDMGLITLEAMKSGKPVLTVDDAGGVVEFVRDGVNGRVVPADAGSLAGAIDALMADRDRLLRMGAAAAATGETVTWKRTVDALLLPADGAARGTSTQVSTRATTSPPKASTAKARTRILVLNTYGVFPPDAGGKKRIFHLYQALARSADVTLLNLGVPGGAAELREFGPHYREVRIPPDPRFQQADAALHRALKASVTDISALLHAHEIPMLASAMRELTANMDVVSSSHVYLAPFIARHWRGELWYDAQNVEADLKADILGVGRLAAPFTAAAGGDGERAGIDAAAAVAFVAAAEAELVRRATRVLAASEDDARRLSALYGRELSRIENAPNGVCPPEDPWLESERRAQLKASFGFGDRPVALFVGSDHGPNRDAIDILVDAARACPDWSFWVVGSICNCPRLEDAPANVSRRRPRLRAGTDGVVQGRRRRPESDAARFRHQSQNARLCRARRAGGFDGNRRSRAGPGRRHPLRLVPAGGTRPDTRHAEVRTAVSPPGDARGGARARRTELFLAVDRRSYFSRHAQRLTAIRSPPAMNKPVPFVVNARPLLGPITGIGRYLSGIMREVEKDGRFEPDYFYATHWNRQLVQEAAGTVPPTLVRMLRSLPPLHSLARALQRRTFASGLRRSDSAFYFEPNFVPFRTELPTVITIHDLSHLRHPETHPVARVRQLERELPAAIDRAAGILTPSEFTRREVIDVFGVNPERVTAAALGVESRFFARSPEETGDVLGRLGLTHRHYFLAVGTLEPRKNLLTTLEAHSRLPQQLRAAYPLVVAGVRGWLTGAISRRLDEARSRGDVRLLGHVGDEQLPALYSGAAMLSYLSVYEGFGLPPLEAMASGVPVAVSDRASLPEVVGDAGILLPPHDVEGLTGLMQRVVEDPGFAEDLRSRGIERASAFTWSRCASLTMRAWENAIRESSA